LNIELSLKEEQYNQGGHYSPPFFYFIHIDMGDIEIL